MMAVRPRTNTLITRVTGARSLATGLGRRSSAAVARALAAGRAAGRGSGGVVGTSSSPASTFPPTPQPQAPRSVRVGHARLLPVPAAALEPLEALLDPGPQAVPAHLCRFGRQVGQHQPGIGVPLVPAGQQRAAQALGGILERL